jgi:hypothetical protein
MRNKFHVTQENGNYNNLYIILTLLVDYSFVYFLSNVINYQLFG